MFSRLQDRLLCRHALVLAIPADNAVRVRPLLAEPSQEEPAFRLLSLFAEPPAIRTSEVEGRIPLGSFDLFLRRLARPAFSAHHMKIPPRIVYEQLFSSTRTRLPVLCQTRSCGESRGERGDSCFMVHPSLLASPSISIFPTVVSMSPAYCAPSFLPIMSMTSLSFLSSRMRL